MHAFCRTSALWAVAVVNLILFPAALQAQQKVGVVANVKVVSDKVKDVSSLEAWKKSYITDGMSDKDKALAIWATVVAHQYQDNPPSEFLQNEGTVYDALKMFNVYGYSYCGVAACETASLARYVGLKARVWTINAHVVSEIMWDNEWHLLDGSLVAYFPKPDGKIASIAEIQADIKAWYEKNPGYKGDGNKLGQFMANGGWKKGPELLAACPLYGENGYLAAQVHSWANTMTEYDGSTSNEYEAGYSLGYKVNCQLRPGEKLTRNWYNKSLFVNMDGTGAAPMCIGMKVGEGNLVHTPKYGDLACGRVGNGVLEYKVPLDTLAGNAWRYENLALGSDKPLLHAADDTKQAILEVRMPCSYVYLKGEVEMDAAVGDGGSIGVLLSDNNGLDWKEVAKIDKSGPQKLDLGKLIIRRYDYRLQLVLSGKGTGLNSLAFRHDIQHSQRALPALTSGENTITFSTGPQEGTITVEGSNNLGNKGKQLVWKDFHPVVKDIEDDLMVNLKRGKGELTYTVDAPGDITKLNISTQYRARDPKGSWDIQVSYDGGKTFTSVAKCLGPTASTGSFVEVKDVPAGTKSVQVKWAGKASNNATMIFNHRIDADYKLPNSGFRPVKVTYLWEEGGVEKKDVHVAQKAQETYKIKCESKPTMKSIILELAQ